MFYVVAQRSWLNWAHSRNLLFTAPLMLSSPPFLLLPHWEFWNQLLITLPEPNQFLSQSASQESKGNLACFPSSLSWCCALLCVSRGCPAPSFHGLRVSVLSFWNVSCPVFHPSSPFLINSSQSFRSQLKKCPQGSPSWRKVLHRFFKSNFSEPVYFASDNLAWFVNLCSL